MIKGTINNTPITSSSTAASTWYSRTGTLNPTLHVMTTAASTPFTIIKKVISKEHAEKELIKELEAYGIVNTVTLINADWHEKQEEMKLWLYQNDIVYYVTDRFSEDGPITVFGFRRHEDKTLFGLTWS